MDTHVVSGRMCHGAVIERGRRLVIWTVDKSHRMFTHVVI